MSLNAHDGCNGEIETEKQRVCCVRCVGMQEVNLLVLNHLLNVGAQYSDRVNIASQETLADVVLFGVLGMFIANSKIDAAFMAACGPSDVSSLFNIPMHVSKEIQPGISVDERGPLADLADLLANTLQRTGRRLAEQKYPDLGGALLHIADAGGSAAELVTKVAQLIEGFDDVEVVQLNDTMFQIPFQKNAQRLVADLYHRFRERCDKFAFPDYSSLYAAPSASSVTTLIQLGVLKLKDAPATPADADDAAAEAQLKVTMAELSATPEACIITRAAAVLAIHRIAESMEQRVEPFDMSLYCEQYNDPSKPQYVPSVGNKW